MIKVNVRNGKTLSFDLKNNNDKRKWDEVYSDSKFQKSITGIGILYNSQWYTLPLPKNFRSAMFYAEIVTHRKNINELVGEKIICHVDDIQISLLVYYGITPKMCRIDVIKIGKLRYTLAIKGSVR